MLQCSPLQYFLLLLRYFCYHTMINTIYSLTKHRLCDRFLQYMDRIFSLSTHTRKMCRLSNETPSRISELICLYVYLAMYQPSSMAAKLARGPSDA